MASTQHKAFQRLSFTLRGYQVGVIEQLDKALHNHKKALIVQATGLGKTAMLCYWILSEILYSLDCGEQRGFLFLCDSILPVDEASHRLSSWLEDLGLSSQIYRRQWYGRHIDTVLEETGNPVIIMGTFQTLRNVSLDQQGYLDRYITHVIVDEAHHAQALTYKNILGLFRGKALIGATATPDRRDNQNISDIFGEPICEFGIPFGVANEYLAQPHYQVMTDFVDLDLIKKEVEKNNGYTFHSLNQLFTKRRSEEIIDILYTTMIEKSLAKGIVFTPSIAYCNEFARLCGAVLPNSIQIIAIHSGLSLRESTRRYLAFKQRRACCSYPCIAIVVDKFNEAIDIPDVELGVFLRYTNSEVIWKQQFGRLLRRTMSKKDAYILDFVQSFERIFMLQEYDKEFHRDMEKEMQRGSYVTHKFVQAYLEMPFFFEQQTIDIIEYLTGMSEFVSYDTFCKIIRGASVSGQKDYNARYKQIGKEYGVRLPSDPHTQYENFRLREALGHEKLGDMATYEEFCYIVQSANITGVIDYGTRYKVLSREYGVRLPAKPREYYDNFSLNDALGRSKKKKFVSYEKFCQVVCNAQVKGLSDYNARYARIGEEYNVRLPSNPNMYYSNFRWDHARGRLFVSYEKFCEIIKVANVLSRRDYLSRYKDIARMYNVRMPAVPRDHYENFSWRHALGHM